ncbi:hypothetical protein HWI79_285 [Cryptosporidium felis]|nr:hypothetical protein HWI79_285 [Cryptosporidium felis]
MLREYEQLKYGILELTGGISSISENRNLPILLNILMDGIEAYNSMLNRRPESSGSCLDMSFWSIQQMDSITATNGGNTTLLDYTLEKIQEQFPSVLSTFEEMNYLERIATGSSIREIFRGVVRLDFGLNERIRPIEEASNGLKRRDENPCRLPYNGEVALKIGNLREISDFLKIEFISLIKDVLHFSRYLGIDGSQEQQIHDIEKICETFQNGQTQAARELSDKLISEIEIEEVEEILSALGLLNWLKGRVSICLGRNFGDNDQKILSKLNGRRESEDPEEENARQLNHQDTQYYESEEQEL